MRNLKVDKDKFVPCDVREMRWKMIVTDRKGDNSYGVITDGLGVLYFRMDSKDETFYIYRTITEFIAMKPYISFYHCVRNLYQLLSVLHPVRGDKDMELVYLHLKNLIFY